MKFKRIKILGRLVAINASNFAEYRLDLAARILAMVFMVIIMAFILSLPFRFTNGLLGWNINDITLVLGVYYVSSGIGWLFYKNNVLQFDKWIKSGFISNMLLKPVSIQLLMSFWEMDFTRISDILAGILLFLRVILIGALHVELGTVVGFVVAFVAGQIFMFSFFFIINSFSFWIEEAYLTHVANPFFDATKYPVDLWVGPARNLLYWILPLGFISTIPVAVLTGKLGIEWSMIALVISFLWLIASNFVLRIGLRKYNGVAS